MPIIELLCRRWRRKNSLFIRMRTARTMQWVFGLCLHYHKFLPQCFFNFIDQQEEILTYNSKQCFLLNPFTMFVVVFLVFNFSWATKNILISTQCWKMVFQISLIINKRQWLIRIFRWRNISCFIGVKQMVQNEQENDVLSFLSFSNCCDLWELWPSTIQINGFGKFFHFSIKYSA